MRTVGALAFAAGFLALGLRVRPVEMTGLT
jgi:hypothetical protein